MTTADTIKNEVSGEARPQNHADQTTERARGAQDGESLPTSMPQVYDPDDLMLSDAIFDECVQCPHCENYLTFLVGYDYDENGAHLVAALVAPPCCDLTEDEVYTLEESAKEAYQAPERPAWPA